MDSATIYKLLYDPLCVCVGVGEGCVCACVCVHINVCTLVYICVCVCVHVHICASTCVNVSAHVIYRPMCVSVLVDMVVIFSDRLYVPCTTYSLIAWRMKVCDSLSVSKYQLQVVWGGGGGGGATVHFIWDNISCIYCVFYWRSFYFVCFVVYFTHGECVQSCPVGAAMTYVLH